MKSLGLLPNRLMPEAGVEYGGGGALCGAELELYNLGVHNAGGGSGIPSNSATQATHANPIENRRPDQSVPQKCAEMGPSSRNPQAIRLRHAGGVLRFNNLLVSIPAPPIRVRRVH